MTKRKRQHLAEIETFSNVFSHPQTEETIPDFSLKGKWCSKYFGNMHPIVVELGCGKGEYTVGLAGRNPDKNFIGIDLKGNRLWRGAKSALEDKMENVAFVRTRIENINTVFSANEVNEIWITFPDPQPRKSKEKKRLTSPRFLDLYKSILSRGGVLHLKTDSREFYEYTLDILKGRNSPVIFHTNDLYGGKEKGDPHAVEASLFKTFYENIFTGKGYPVCFIKFGLG